MTPPTPTLVPLLRAYLGFYFGGGGSLLGGFGGMLPEKSFINGAIWCVLENILLKFCPQKISKNIHFFHIKIMDNVLLRTIFRGIRAYSPDFLSIVQFSVFWHAFSVNFYLRKYIIHI